MFYVTCGFYGELALLNDELKSYLSEWDDLWSDPINELGLFSKPSP